MKPPDNTGGYTTGTVCETLATFASMKPPDNTGGYPSSTVETLQAGSEPQ